MNKQEAQNALEVALARFGQATYEAERWAARKAECAAAVAASEAAFMQASSVPVAEAGDRTPSKQ